MPFSGRWNFVIVLARRPIVGRCNPINFGLSRVGEVPDRDHRLVIDG